MKVTVTYSDIHILHATNMMSSSTQSFFFFFYFGFIFYQDIQIVLITDKGNDETSKLVIVKVKLSIKKYNIVLPRVDNLKLYIKQTLNVDKKVLK